MNAWLPVGAWMLVIFVLSGNEFSAEQTRGLIAWVLHAILPPLSPALFGLVHDAVRKLAHVTEYAVLGMLALRGFQISRPQWPTQRQLGSAFALAAAWAIVDETNQALQPDRTGTPLDVALDSFGALLGVWMLWATRARESMA